MTISTRTWLNLGILLAIVLIFVTYRYGFSDRFHNLSTQTAVLDLSQRRKVILIEKHAEQGNIVELELRVSGKLSENITINLSEDGLNSSTSIRIKKGKIDTSFITKWKSDKAYILLENPNESKSKIELEYQFLTAQ